MPKVLISDKLSPAAIDIFKQALDNIEPKVEVKSRRVGGATHQVPVEVRANRRQTLAMRAQLTSVPVLEGLGSGAFLVEDSDPCAVRRFTFLGSMDAAHGALAVHLGGLLLNGQRHPDCP